MTNPIQLYPLKFNPILKDKIWGGSKLRDVLKKKSGEECGESWEVSGIKGDESVVSNGQLAGLSLSDLIKIYGGALLGVNVFNKFGSEFPLLIKFIDANANLSIQVHPNDEQSGGHGKTEMWYVIAADEGSTLLSGFNQDVTKEVLRDSIMDGSFEKYMNKVAVKEGDAFFIEANQVHTIGKGILIAEIQQSSDITYRIHDFDRLDDHGNRRELHVNKSFEVMRIDQQTGQVSYDEGAENELVRSPEFVTQRLEIRSDLKLETEANFAVLIVVEGEGKIKWEDKEMEIAVGESLLIPAQMDISVLGNPQLTLLKTYIDN